MASFNFSNLLSGPINAINNVANVAKQASSGMGPGPTAARNRAANNANRNPSSGVAMGPGPTAARASAGNAASNGAAAAGSIRIPNGGDSVSKQPGYGTGSPNGSTNGSSGGSGGSTGGASAPSAPTTPVAPPAPPSIDYHSIVRPITQRLGKILNDKNYGTAHYAAAAKQINDRLAAAASPEHKQALVDAFIDSFSNYSSRSKARNDLMRTGNLSTDIIPVDPATVAPATETIIIPDAKSDSLYKRQSTDLAQQLADFQGDQNLANTQYDTQYADVLRKMGWNGGTKSWDQSPTSGAYGEATNDNLDDFVGRGLGYSGLLSQGQAQIDKKFNEQKNDVDRQSQDFDDTQARSLGTFKNKNSQAISQALEDAISRITQQYGVDRSAVKVGSNNTITREKAS